ncbi:hypothetical protein SAMN04488136_1115 [Vibrio xiamenensis]|uniref:Uncharacterized protein n=1 Tax=Vibrio xiamenensis TaxID=861298 RepID=A0A1G8AM06_9VIBR|nr:hypothetical protein SAMN04488136_1115 [Vibrio xiamenensis]
MVLDSITKDSVQAVQKCDLKLCSYHVFMSLMMLEIVFIRRGQK